MNKISDKHLTFLICLALALSTFFVFLQVRNHQFISFDDDIKPEYLQESRCFTHDYQILMDTWMKNAKSSKPSPDLIRPDFDPNSEAF
jgi:hypothetical protein